VTWLAPEEIITATAVSAHGRRVRDAGVVDWFNKRRLFELPGHIPRAELEMGDVGDVPRIVELVS
jgi:hypothetical protein